MNGKTRRVLGPALLVLGCSLVVPARVAAEQVTTDNDLLRQGLELYDELEYERAVEVLSAALLEPGNDRAEQTAIFRTLGVIYVLLGRDTQARLALTRLLCVQPDFRFDEYTSPRISGVFDEVRRAWEDGGRPCPEAETPRPPTALPSVEMDHESPASAGAGETLVLRVAVEDPALRVNAVRLYYRAPGEGTYDEVTASMDSPGRFSAEIPGEAVAPPAAEYYFRALDDDGTALATMGTARAPLRVPVAETGGRGRSVVRSWWLWTIVGVAVAGVATGVTLGVLYGGGEPPGPQPATLTISVCDPETLSCP